MPDAFVSIFKALILSSLETKMTVLKISAFSDGDTGGNPAGVVLGEQLSTLQEM